MPAEHRIEAPLGGESESACTPRRPAGAGDELPNLGRHGCGLSAEAWQHGDLRYSTRLCQRCHQVAVVAGDAAGGAEAVGEKCQQAHGPTPEPSAPPTAGTNVLQPA